MNTSCHGDETLKEFAIVVSQPIDNIVVEVAEKGIDLLFRSPDLVQAIPIARTFLGIVKAGYAIRHLFFVKKVAKFLSRVQDGTVEESDRQTFREKLESGTTEARKIVNLTLLQLELHDDEVKSLILGEILKAYISATIDYHTYVVLAFCVNSVHPLGFRMLLELSRDESKSKDPLVGAILVGTGLVGYNTVGPWIDNEGGVFPTDLGQRLCEIALKELEAHLL